MPFVVRTGPDSLAALLARGDGTRAVAHVSLATGGLREVPLSTVPSATIRDFAVGPDGMHYAVANTDVVAFDASALRVGVYVVRAEAAGHVVTRALTVLR
ncbi:MAG TPA: hypothetical protein VD962_13670 [Rubricoccaceae bacterium]|nr:hypothetical protein [Rubricoccaceae bacterium]